MSDFAKKTENVLTKMYWDTFGREYTLRIDEIAPPERYVTTYRGEPGIYIEQWIVSKDGVEEELRLDVAYSEIEYRNPMLHNMKLERMCKENNCRALYLCGFVLPQEKFDEYVERFGLAEQEDEDEDELADLADFECGD